MMQNFLYLLIVHFLAKLCFSIVVFQPKQLSSTSNCYKKVGRVKAIYEVCTCTTWSQATEQEGLISYDELFISSY